MFTFACNWHIEKISTCFIISKGQSVIFKIRIFVLWLFKHIMHNHYHTSYMHLEKRHCKSLKAVIVVYSWIIYRNDKKYQLSFWYVTLIQITLLILSQNINVNVKVKLCKSASQLSAYINNRMTCFMGVINNMLVCQLKPANKRLALYHFIGKSLLLMVTISKVM